MRNIKICLWAVLLGIPILWLAADSLFPQPFNYFAFRGVFNQLSGLMAIGAMSGCMILAARTERIEQKLGGLDKVYRLHKWLGITALVTSLAHFWFTKGTKWMVGWGWLERPARKPNGMNQVADQVQNLETWLRGFRHTAESVGEWAFYLALVLMIMALVKAIPYRYFVKLHKWLAVLYLGLVFHAVILIKFAYWKQPIGWLAAVLLLGSTLAALAILFKQSGKAKRYTGTLTAMQTFPASHAFQLSIDVPKWKGHRAGQFAFVKHHATHEAPHPFTLVSSGSPDNHTLTFLIKELGDYTSDWYQHLKIGDAFTIEGPYGGFTFQSEHKNQVWLAGGIGVTPFLARLRTLADTKQPLSGSIDFVFSYRDEDTDLLSEIRTLAEKCGVRFHPWCSATSGRLNGNKLANLVPEEQLQQSTFWLCGNTQWGNNLKTDLTKHGVRAQDFHQELFEFR